MHLLAHGLSQNGRSDEALGHYRTLVATRGDVAHFRTDLAREPERKGHLEESMATWRSAVQAFPDDAGLHNGTAWSLATCPDENLREPTEAVGLARRAVALMPETATFGNTLGTALWRAGELDECVSAMERSMEFGNGGDPHDWLVLAIACHKQGNDRGPELYQRSLAWIAENGSGMSEADLQVLESFRKEAAAVLGIGEKKSEDGGAEGGAAEDGGKDF